VVKPLAAALALALATQARADVSLSDGKQAGRLHCAREDSSYQRGLASPEVQKWQRTVAPGLHFAQAGHAYLLFSTFWSDVPRRSVVLDSATGREIMSVRDHDTALVEDSAGSLFGLLRIDGDKHELRFHDLGGGVRWRTPLPSLWGDSASVVVSNGTLYAGIYHRIATGSSLVALDLATGRLRWTADVQQLVVSHSKYSNDVSLELRGGSVVMHGVESAGCYVQVFDAATGRRTSSVVERSW
jgi:outer membrane protein assembly factor BamB